MVMHEAQVTWRDAGAGTESVSVLAMELPAGGIGRAGWDELSSVAAAAVSETHGIDDPEIVEVGIPATSGRRACP